MKIFDLLKTNDSNKTFCAWVVTTNGFALNHNKSLQIYFFCVKRQAKNDSLKDKTSKARNFTRLINGIWKNDAMFMSNFPIVS